MDRGGFYNLLFLWYNYFDGGLYNGKNKCDEDFRSEENKIPIKFIGVGEQIDDMEIFNSKDFAKAII